ncbi:transposase [Vannielia litorea]|nr:transposase [Vannielia litorea]MBY6074117.1 transposase [Vannielia litorea]
MDIRVVNMSALFWLSNVKKVRLEHFFSKSRGEPRVGARRVLSGIIFTNRSGLRWCGAPAVYGRRKALCNRWKRRSNRGVFARIFAGLAP